MFITLYGINNIGKSTHAQKIVEKLNQEGKEAIYLKYPIYNIEPTGPQLNQILRGNKQDISEEELQIWFTLNRYQSEPQLKKYLSEGKIVIAEDYIGTALAWGSAKGADLAWLEGLNKHLLKEDLSIMLRGQRTLSSIEKGHIHEQNSDLAAKCEDQLALLAQKYNWTVIDAGSKNESQRTFDRIWEVVERVLKD